MDMKKLVTFAALGVALATAGCSKTADGPVKREAGKWATEVKVEKLDIEGIPPEIKAQMEQQMKTTRTFEECLTAEQAAKEDIAGDMSKASGSGGCTWKKNSVADGKIDIAGTCNGAAGPSELAMTGTLAAKNTDVTITMKSKSPTGGNMEVVMHATGKHGGACTT
jgi:hypothetical protein